MIFFYRVLTLADLKNPARGHKVKTHPETRQAAVVEQPSRSYILGKSKIQRQQTVRREQQRKNKKQNKSNDKIKTRDRNARDTQYSIGHVPERIRVRATMANQLVRATVAKQLLRANQYEHACFGPPSPWSFPSRSGILLHAVVLPWLSRLRSISS